MVSNIRQTVPSLIDLINELPRINTFNKQELDDQWRDIPYHKFPEESNVKQLQKDPESFHRYIINIEDDFGNFKFKSLGQFALEVLSLPCSNADG